MFKYVSIDALARITLPALPQFTAAVAEELLILIGPRRLTSLLLRIQRQGLWRETQRVSKKFKSKNGDITYKTVTVGKYENELRLLQRIKKTGGDWEGFHPGDTGMIFSPERIDELLVLMSPGPAAQSDDEIAIAVNKWIEGERAKRLVPEPLSESDLEPYERTFQPRAVRLSEEAE